jgi:HNH endonuclease
MTISINSRQRIRQRANFLCEYCHSSEEASTSLFTFDHLIPQSLGGDDTEHNLALACHRCNSRRYNFTDGIGPETQIPVPLFNPRQNNWPEHFIWSTDGQKILAVTSIRRATLKRFYQEAAELGSIRLDRTNRVVECAHSPEFYSSWIKG